MDQKYEELGNTHVMKSCKNKQSELFLGWIGLHPRDLHQQTFPAFADTLHVSSVG